MNNPNAKSPLQDIESTNVLVICGPTASGKSALAQQVAQARSAEIISADSMQIYRGMDIGTGKVLPQEQIVPHYGIDIVDPDEPYSVALFQDYARSCIVDINARNKLPLLCGGTGFYIRAVIDDYHFPQGDQVENEIRSYYNNYAETQGNAALWKLLEKEDPQSAALIPENDTKRIVRAFELLEAGENYYKQREKLKALPQLMPACMIGIAVDSDVLRKRIDSRIDAMVENGLLTEVEKLIEAGFKDAICANQAIGYKEFIDYLDGICSLDHAIATLKTATHHYAKRQRTWFRKDKRIHWIDGTHSSLDELTHQSLSIVDTMGFKKESQ